MPTSEPRADDGGPALGLIAHARYACRHSGVCCSSDWEIPVEDALHARLARAIDAGDLRPRDGVGLVDRAGPAGGHAIGPRPPHRAAACSTPPDRAAAACTRGAAPTPSPSPAGSFPGSPCTIRAAPSRRSRTCVRRRRIGSPIPALLVLAPLPRAAASLDGLDVRRSLPPALSPRRLLDWDALSAWETQALDACARNDAPEGVLQDLLALRDACAALDRGAGSARRVDRVVDPGRAAIGGCGMAAGSGARRDRPRVRTGGARRAAAGRERRCAAAGAGGAPLIRRYLAARLIACWPLHYGTGVATAIAYAAALLSVLAVEMARQAPSPEAAAGDAAVLAAIAETDRLVVHLAAPDALARGLDAWAVRHLDGGL